MLAVDCGLRTGGVMKQWTVRMRMVPVLVAIVAVVAAVSLQAASAKTHKPVVVPPDAVLTWNTYTVNAVRASTPTKFQTDGMVYMSYAQAAVYDAVTKMMGRYQPYHDFAFTVAPGASVQAAVAAAAQTILDHYMLDQRDRRRRVQRLHPHGAAWVRRRRRCRGRPGGRRRHHLAAHRRRSQQHGGAELRRERADPARAVAAAAEPEGADAVRRDDASVPAGGAPRSSGPRRRRRSTSHLYARDLNETEAYGAINSTVRTPDETAIAYFWVGFNVNQYNATFQNVVDQHDMDLVDAAHLLAMGNIVTTDAGIACYDSKFFYQLWRPITAIQNADKDNNPDTTADPTWQSVLPVPGHPEYPSMHGCFTSAFADTIAAALHTQHLDVTIPEGRTEAACSAPPALQHRQRHRPAGRRRQGLARLPLPQLGPAGREARQPRRRLGARPLLQARRAVTRSRTAAWPASARATRPAGYFVAVKRPNIDGSCGGQ